MTSDEDKYLYIQCLKHCMNRTSRVLMLKIKDLRSHDSTTGTILKVPLNQLFPTQPSILTCKEQPRAHTNKAILSTIILIVLKYYTTITVQ